MLWIFQRCAVLITIVGKLQLFHDLTAFVLIQASDNDTTPSSASS